MTYKMYEVIHSVRLKRYLKYEVSQRYKAKSLDHEI